MLVSVRLGQISSSFYFIFRVRAALTAGADQQKFMKKKKIMNRKKFDLEKILRRKRVVKENFFSVSLEIKLLPETPRTSRQ